MANRNHIDANSARMQLPLLVIHCLLGIAAREHARANVLRQRRSRRMGVASRIAEAVARDISAEVRQ